jgi:hypothetical protein
MHGLMAELKERERASTSKTPTGMYRHSHACRHSRRRSVDSESSDDIKNFNDASPRSGDKTGRWWLKPNTICLTTAKGRALIKLGRETGRPATPGGRCGSSQHPARRRHHHHHAAAATLVRRLGASAGIRPQSSVDATPASPGRPPGRPEGQCMGFAKENRNSEACSLSDAFDCRARPIDGPTSLKPYLQDDEVFLS